MSPGLAKLIFCHVQEGPTFGNKKNAECQYNPAKTIDEAAFDDAAKIAGALPKFWHCA